MGWGRDPQPGCETIKLAVGDPKLANEGQAGITLLLAGGVPPAEASIWSRPTERIDQQVEDAPSLRRCLPAGRRRATPRGTSLDSPNARRAV
jgi:hypothetical protein